MAIGISPLVDFAFKLMLGSPEHSGVTIHVSEFDSDRSAKDHTRRDPESVFGEAV